MIRKTSPTVTRYTATGFMVAEEYYVNPITDLNQKLVLDPAATYYHRMTGNAMLGAGIPDRSFLVIDASLTPANGDPVFVWYEDRFYCRLYHKDKYGIIKLTSPDKDVAPLLVNNENFKLIGIVTWSLKNVTPRHFPEIEVW